MEAVVEVAVIAEVHAEVVVETVAVEAALAADVDRETAAEAVVATAAAGVSAVVATEAGRPTGRRRWVPAQGRSRARPKLDNKNAPPATRGRVHFSAGTL